MSPWESIGKTDFFFPLFERWNINCSCSSSNCSLKPGLEKKKILFHELKNRSMWNILFSLSFPRPSPASLNWEGRTSNQRQGESKSSLAVPTAFGHSLEGSGFCSIFWTATPTSRQIYSKQHQVWLSVLSIAWQLLRLQKMRCQGLLLRWTFGWL